MDPDDKRDIRQTDRDRKIQRDRETETDGRGCMGGGGAGDQGVVGEIIGCGDDGVKRRHGGDSFVPDS